MIVECNKGKSSLLATASISHDVDYFNLAKLLKVVSKMMLFCVFLNATHKYFFDSCVSTRPA